MARHHAFVKEMERYAGGVEFATEADVDSPEGGRRAARRLLETGFSPTAIVCVNDFMALGVLRELHDQGLSVPGDVSVTGFDNINLSEFTFPPLTTVNVPRELIGQTIFEALAPEEGQPRVPREFVLHPELVIRDSTSAAKC